MAAKNPEKETFVGSSTVNPLWSPDGKWLAYHVYRSEDEANQIKLYNLNTGEHEKTSLPSGAQAVSW